jgi:hypothetical protein
MKQVVIHVLNSRFGRISRLAALLTVVASILNTQITLPTSIMVSDAAAQGTITSTNVSVPEMPILLMPVFVALLATMALRMRRRIIANTL